MKENKVDCTQSKFKAGTRFPLDAVGQCYASIINSELTGNYTISATLKEEINPEILQKVVDDLFKRLPFLNGKLVEGEFGFEHEVLADAPKISVDKGVDSFEQFYKHGQGHVIRVVYGKYHFKVESIHSIIDGRSTTELAKALLVRYFKLAGLEVECDYVISCDEEVKDSEAENAFARFANYKEKVSQPKKEKNDEKEAYLHEGSLPAKARIEVLNFDLAKLKSVAKSYGVTINNYILAHLFEVIAEERNSRNSQKTISIVVPVDCRAFFPTETLRNFVAGPIIHMPETQIFSEIIGGIQSQCANINSDLLQSKINEMQELEDTYQDMPLSDKKEIWKTIYEAQFEKSTTTFSNIGLVKLPSEIESHVASMEFVISPTGQAYSFGCIAVGNVMTLSITSSVQENEIADKLKARLES